LRRRSLNLKGRAVPVSVSITVGLVYDGPLDLLLDLIRKQDIDIYDIPIARITAQFFGLLRSVEADGCGFGW